MTRVDTEAQKETEPVGRKADLECPGGLPEVQSPWTTQGQVEGASAYSSASLSKQSSLDPPPGNQAGWAERGKGELSIHTLDSGGTYRTRHLHPYVSAVQWRVAALPRSPLGGICPFLVLPAPHGEGEQVPAWSPPVPCVVGVSILLLGRERQVGHEPGQLETKVPSQQGTGGMPTSLNVSLLMLGNR